MALPDNIEAWTAVALSIAALGQQVRSFIKKNREDKRQIKKAMEEGPLIQKQLELGNTKEEVAIQASMVLQWQEFYKQREAQRDKREEELEEEIQELRSKVSHLERENESLHLEIRELKRGS